MPLYEVTSYDSQARQIYKDYIDEEYASDAAMIVRMRRPDVDDAKAILLEDAIRLLMQQSHKWTAVQSLLASLKDWQCQTDELIEKFRDGNQVPNDGGYGYLDFDGEMADQREILHDLVRVYLNEQKAMRPTEA